ncbi:MAG: RidA family protein [Acidimicrobiales bacterium]
MSMTGTAEERLELLGITLPPPLPPLTGHAPLVISRGMAYVSGHGPLDQDRVPLFAGRVGGERTEAEGHAAARLCALNVLASLRAELGSLNRVAQVVRLTGYVSSTDDFHRQPWVVDGASEVFQEVFGPERGRHARTSVGVSTTALDMTVTIDTLFELEPE